MCHLLDTAIPSYSLRHQGIDPITKMNSGNFVNFCSSSSGSYRFFFVLIFFIKGSGKFRGRETANLVNCLLFQDVEFSLDAQYPCKSQEECSLFLSQKKLHPWSSLAKQRKWIIQLTMNGFKEKNLSQKIGMGVGIQDSQHKPL